MTHPGDTWYEENGLKSARVKGDSRRCPKASTVCTEFLSPLYLEWDQLFSIFGRTEETVTQFSAGLGSLQSPGEKS